MAINSAEACMDTRGAFCSFHCWVHGAARCTGGGVWEREQRPIALRLRWKLRGNVACFCAFGFGR
eukprot:9724140-Alexandrium_andersonii.AAC.1